MKKLPEGISARSISLQTKNGFHFTQITIKNGFLWGKNQRNNFVHVNLNNRTNVVVEEYTSYGEISFYSVCPNGEMCYVKTKAERNSDFIFTYDKKNYPLNVLPEYVAQKATWISFKNQSKPYLFLNIRNPREPNGIQFCYFNFNNQVSYCVPAIINPPVPGKILAFSLFQYDNQKIGASFLIHDEKNICPYQLYPSIFKDETFMAPDNNQCQEAYLPLTKFSEKNLYFLENQYIGISTEDLFYTILLEPSKDVTIRSIHLENLNFDVNPNADKIFISNNIIFQFMKDELSFFLISKNRTEQAIDKVKLYDDQIFEVDTYSSNIYSISNNNVITNYQFSSNITATGFDSFLFWLYFRLIKEQTKQSISSAAIILLQTSASFDQKFNLARNQSDSFRLEVFMKLLETVKETHPVQRTVIAAMALDLYVRNETSEAVNKRNEEEKNEKVKEFIKWANFLITKKILTPSIIEKTLFQYNWNEALAAFLQPQAAFEMNMQLGQYEEARKRLKQIQESNDFSHSALRLHSLIPGDAVYKDVKERDDALTDGTLIPLMENEHYIDHLKQLFSSGRLTSHWLRSLFAVYMARSPDTFCINQYFKNFNSDSEVMIRSLLSSKRYSEVAHGICSQENYQSLLPMAVSFLSKVSPQKAFELIPDDVSLPLKRRCALKILRSMKREDAEIVAQKSLLNSISGIDAATLIEYMPQTTKVEKMSKAIKRYANRNLIIENEEKKKSEEALEGIRCSNQLVEKREPQIVKLYKFSICCRCQRPLLNEPAVVYPCSHALHIQCATELFKSVLFVIPNYPPKRDINSISNNNYINNNANSSNSFDLNSTNTQPDLTADCPLCGFLCIKNINEPFEPKRDPTNDEWETDQTTLSKFLK